MKKNKFIFNEGIDYFKEGNQSIWGAGDSETIKLLKKTNINGHWLNLAAGDGRYNNLFINKAAKVTAADIDEGALNKLFFLTPKNQQKKLDLKTLNIIKKFPFKDSSFDGILATGILYLFPEAILSRIFKEIFRVLKKGGALVFDFATDRKKTTIEGRTIKNNQVRYNNRQAEKLINKLMSDYEFKIIKSEVPQELTTIGSKKYYFSCNFLLVSGIKRL